MGLAERGLSDGGLRCIRVVWLTCWGMKDEFCFSTILLVGLIFFCNMVSLYPKFCVSAVDGGGRSVKLHSCMVVVEFYPMSARTSFFYHHCFPMEEDGG